MNVIRPNSRLSDGSGNAQSHVVIWMSQVSDLLTGLTQSGITGDRPTKLLYVGRRYFDTTLGYPVWYDGTNWVNASGSTV